MAKTMFVFDLSNVQMVPRDEVADEMRADTVALACRLWPEVNPSWLGLTDAEVLLEGAKP